MDFGRLFYKDNLQVAIFALLGFAAGWYFFFVGFRRLKRCRTIENTPSSPIRSIPLGPIEIQGQAVQKYEIFSPFTQKSCCYYYYKIEELRRSRKRSHWVTIDKGDSATIEFYVDDGTGAITVIPKGADVIVANDHTFQNGWGKQIPDSAITYLESRGKSATGWLGMNKTLRFTEAYVLPGDHVYVLGNAVSKTDADLQNRTQILTDKLRELKANPELMARLDRNRDGKVSAEEWEEARRIVERSIIKRLTSGPAEICITSHPDRDFIISDHSEKELLSKYRWQIIGGIFGGPLLAALGLSVLLWLMGVL